MKGIGKRLNPVEIFEMIALWENGGQNCRMLGEKFGISAVAVGGLLKRRGYAMIPQTILQRKYPIKEDFFDDIDSEAKAYFLGFLYADGYNNTDRYSVALSLQDKDRQILEKLNSLIQPTKPLQFVITKAISNSNQYRLVIANKRISQRIAELGCPKAKTFNIEFPSFMPRTLISHFVRGYFDGDGSIGKTNCCIVATHSFCLSLTEIFKRELEITPYLRTRHPERNHNIRMLEISGGRQLRRFLKWLYKDATIYMQRKYEKFKQHIEYEAKLGKERLCSIEGCQQKHVGRGLCRQHYYKLAGGMEKRRERYLTTGG